MKDKKNITGKNEKNKKDLKAPTIPVPPVATELSEEDLKKVTGGVPPGPQQIPPGPAQ